MPIDEPAFSLHNAVVASVEYFASPLPNLKSYRANINSKKHFKTSKVNFSVNSIEFLDFTFKGRLI